MKYCYFSCNLNFVTKDDLVDDKIVINLNKDSNNKYGQYFIYLCEKAYSSLCHESSQIIIPNQEEIPKELLSLFTSNLSGLDLLFNYITLI